MEAANSGRSHNFREGSAALVAARRVTVGFQAQGERPGRRRIDEAGSSCIVDWIAHLIDASRNTRHPDAIVPQRTARHYVTNFNQHEFR
jgi:hypothetical protein